MTRPLFLVVCWLAMVSLLGSCALFCESKKTAERACTHTATILDYRKLDGCQWLLRLDDSLSAPHQGRLLLPQAWPDDFEPRAGMRVRIGFEPVRDVMTICMAEDLVVQLTCIQPLSENTRPQPLPCLKIDNPFEVDWMDRALDRYNPDRVVRYPWRDGWVYLLEGQETWALFDCQGTLLCTTEGDPNDKCHRNYLNQLRNGKVIWVGEGMWD